MEPIRATFIGIGAQKCASTWLYGALQQMPQVRISDVKEVDFFSAYFDRGYEWYGRHFSGGIDILHRGEISPSYFADADTPARAQAYNPDLHILVTLRNPVARAFSNHLHEVRKGHVSGDNLRFESAMANNPFYLEQGRYAAHLARWYDHFPAERIHVLFQEEIHAAPGAAANAVADALSLPRIENFLVRQANESVIYRRALVGQFLWRLGYFARRRGLGTVVEAMKSAPGIRTMRAANRQNVRDAIPPMEETTVARLTDLYAPEVEALAAQIGRQPPWPDLTTDVGDVPRVNA